MSSVLNDYRMLAAEELQRHIAWDIGALAVANWAERIATALRDAGGALPESDR